MAHALFLNCVLALVCMASCGIHLHGNKVGDSTPLAVKGCGANCEHCRRQFLSPKRGGMKRPTWTLHPRWQPLEDDPAGPPMQFFTIADQSYRGIDCMFLSAAYFNVTLSVMGWGGEVNMQSAGKLPSIAGALQGLANNTFVVFTDATDVLYTASPRRIWTHFHRLFDANLVFSAQTCCALRQVGGPRHGTQSICRDYPPGKTPWRYLNSGMFMGWAWAAKEFMARAVRLRNAYPQGVGASYGNALGEFCVISERYELLYNCLTGYRPFLLHFPGAWRQMNSWVWFVMNRTQAQETQASVLLNGRQPMAVNVTHCLGLFPR